MHKQYIPPHSADKNSLEEVLSVNAGPEVEAYVTTTLSSEGKFWVQLEGGDEYTTMMKGLQDAVGEMSTSTHFSPGVLCAALFSEDNLWYRAQVESRQGEMVSGERGEG